MKKKYPAFRYNGWRVWQNSFRWQARHLETGEWHSFKLDASTETIKQALDDPERRKQMTIGRKIELDGLIVSINRSARR